MVIFASPNQYFIYFTEKITVVKKRGNYSNFKEGLKYWYFPLITGISLEILGKKHNCILHTFNQICWNEHRSTPYRQRHLVIVLEFNRFWLPTNALGIYLKIITKFLISSNSQFRKQSVVFPGTGSKFQYLPLVFSERGIFWPMVPFYQCLPAPWIWWPSSKKNPLTHAL